MAPKAEAFDTTRWLKEDLGFSDDDVKVLLPKFEARKEKVAGGYLRQADYNRAMDEGRQSLQRLQADLKAKDDQLTREMAEWASLQQGDEKKAETLRTELEQTRLEKFQLEQRIKAVAEEHGLDMTKILPTGTTPPPAPGAPGSTPPPKAPDLSQFVSTTQFGGVVDYMLSLPAELAAIGHEHHALTGQVLDTRPLVQELKARVAAKKPADLRTIWEEQHKIPDLRETKAKEKYEADLKAAEARGREAARSEAALPNQHPVGHTAPVFTKLGPGESGGSKLQRPQPGVQTRNFAESLRSRKYAQGPAASGGAGTPGAK
jgi:hypothetical protein